MSTDRVARRWGLLAFSLIWALTSLYVLRHFYELGGMRDSLWFAGLAHRGDLAMSDPPSVAFAQGASFFHTHFSPVFYLPSALSYLTPLPPAAWYAVWYGVMHGLLAWSFYILVSPLTRIAGYSAAGAVSGVLALAFALNGNAMVALQMPHFEVLIPALTVGVMALLIRGQFRAACATLGLTILVREDAGLHVAALFLPAYMWLRLRNPGKELKSLARQIGLFGAMALAGAVLCLAIQKFGWGDNGMLIRNYLGTPPFAHLSSDLLQSRWNSFVDERSYLWLPAVISAIWALVTRRILILWGYIAYVPWLALQFLAKEDVMGKLSWYYAFPAMASLAWPLMAEQLTGPAVHKAAARQTIWWTSLILLSTLAGQVNGRNMLYAWQIAQQLSVSPAPMRADEAFMQTLLARSTQLGHLRLDNGVIALRPRAFRADQRAEVIGIEQQAIDTLIWFDPGGFDSTCWSLADSKGLHYRFAVPDSPIVIASRQDLLTDKAWQARLVRTNLFARRTQTALPRDAVSGGWRISANTPEGPVLQAPLIQRTDGLYDITSVTLSPGTYQLEAIVHVNKFSPEGQPLFKLRRHHEWAPQLDETLMVDQHNLANLGQGRWRLTWPLSIPAPPQGGYWPNMMKLEWLHTGQSSYTIESWTLQARR